MLQRGSFGLLLLRKLLKGINEKALFRSETGTGCHDHPREIVGRSRQNCLSNMTDGVIDGRKLDLC